VTHWFAWYEDGCGMPRAYASAPTKGGAEAEALRQVNAYIAAKRELGDPVFFSDFTLCVNEAVNVGKPAKEGAK
jgi:hypothetical protein